MEIYKIEAPFGAITLLRKSLDESSATEHISLNEQDPDDAVIELVPSRKYDFEIKTNLVTNDFTLYCVAAFVAKVLGYPYGQYEVLTREGVKSITLFKRWNGAVIKHYKCKLLCEKQWKYQDSMIRYCDVRCGDCAVRLTECYDCCHFDIDSLCAAMLRNDSRDNDFRGLVAYSPTSSTGEFEMRVSLRNQPGCKRIPAEYFAALGFFVSGNALEEEIIKFVSPLGSVSVVKTLMGELSVFAEEVFVSRIY